MKKKFLLYFILCGTFAALIISQNQNQSLAKTTTPKTLINDCSFNGIQLYGKVQVVNAFPDIKVQVVTAFPDLKVQAVEAFPGQCGQWQFVEAFPDFTIQFVEAFPDVKIQYVQAFPGLP